METVTNSIVLRYSKSTSLHLLNMKVGSGLVGSRLVGYTKLPKACFRHNLLEMLPET